MDESQLDALLRAVPDDPPPPEVADLDLQALQALRAGALPEADAAQVDARLAADPAARAALRALAEPVPGGLATWARTHGPPGSARRLWPAVGGALALAAALVILVLRAGGPPPPAYRLGEIGGAAQAVRGDRVAETQVFLPRSRITLTVLPEGEEPAAAPTLKVFVSAGDGPLAPGERVKVLAKDGAFRVQAEAGTLFGAEAGPKRLWVGLAADGAALDGAAGLAPAAARELAGVRWLEVPVDYRLVGP